MSYYAPPGGTPYQYAYNPQTGQYTNTPASGAYPYSTSYGPSTGVTSYGTPWTYHQQAYTSYYTQQAQQAQASAAKPATTPSGASTSTITPAVAATTASTSTPAPVTAVTQAATQPRPVVAAAPSAYSTFSANYARDPATTGGGRAYRKGTNHKGLFTKELRNLMYGFGDDRNPANDTVNLMEEILIEYIVDVCQTASGGGKKARLSVEDLRRALSNPADAKKLARMEELLFMQEDIKRARAQFDESDMNQVGSV